MILSLKKDINMWFFNNENTSCKKSYTPCYVSVIVPEESHSSVEDG